MKTISIRFARWWGASFFAVAGLNLVVFGMTGAGMQLGLAAMFALMGGLYMASTAIVVTEREVQLKNALGMVMKRHPFKSLASLELDGNKLFIAEDGQRKRVASLGFHVNAADKEQLRAAIDNAAFD